MIGRWIRFFLGTLVTIVCFSLLLGKVDWNSLVSSITTANYYYVSAAVGVYFIALIGRSARWAFLLRGFGIYSWRRLYPVVVVGYSANNLLPMRLGEIVRAYHLSKRENIKVSSVLGSVVVERTFDVFALVILFGLLLLFLPADDLLGELGSRLSVSSSSMMILGGIFFLSGVGLMIAMAKYQVVMRRGMLVLGTPLPATIRAKLSESVDLFLLAFSRLTNLRHLIWMTLMSIAIWSLEAIMYYLVALAFGLDAYFDETILFGGVILLVTVLANLATSVPSSQGSIGPFEFCAVVALGLFGVQHSISTAYALVLHGTLLVPVTIVGILYLIINNISIRELARGNSTRNKQQGKFEI